MTQVMQCIGDCQYSIIVANNDSFLNITYHCSVRSHHEILYRTLSMFLAYSHPRYYKALVDVDTVATRIIRQMWRHNLTIPHTADIVNKTPPRKSCRCGDILELQNVVTKVDVLVYKNVVHAIVHVNVWRHKVQRIETQRKHSTKRKSQTLQSKSTRLSAVSISECDDADEVKSLYYTEFRWSNRPHLVSRNPSRKKHVRDFSYLQTILSSS